MAVAEVQMRAVQGPCARRGMLDAGARSRHDVVGTHRSKERLSAPAQRGRAGLVVVSLQGAGHGDGKNWPIWSMMVKPREKNTKSNICPVSLIVVDKATWGVREPALKQ